MAVYISVSTDPFSTAFDQARMRQPQINVRRPLRGITIKEDTYAVIRVLDSSGNPIPVFDSSSPTVTNDIGTSSFYANFIIQQVAEQRMEKQQIVETFGDDYIFFFGERPRFITVGGVLLNTKDFNWKSEFWENYDRYLRGTKLVENNARLYLYFDDVVIEGYIVSASVSQEAMSPHHLPFQFQLFVTNYATLSTVGSVFFQRGGALGVFDVGLAAESSSAQVDQATGVGRKSSGGGLNSFLAGAASLANDLSFSIQSTLETIKNTFYGRRIVFPEGIGQTLYQAPIQNLATFGYPHDTVGRPIHEMNDEYPERGDNRNVEVDQREIARVNAQLALRDPVELEAKARAELAKMGIDTTRRDPSYLLLGRGAFAAAQYMGSFGIRQVDGNLLDEALTGASVNLP